MQRRYVYLWGLVIVVLSGCGLLAEDEEGGTQDDDQSCTLMGSFSVGSHSPAAVKVKWALPYQASSHVLYRDGMPLVTLAGEETSYIDEDWPVPDEVEPPEALEAQQGDHILLQWEPAEPAPVSDDLEYSVYQLTSEFGPEDPCAISFALPGIPSSFGVEHYEVYVDDTLYSTPWGTTITLRPGQLDGGALEAHEEGDGMVRLEVSPPEILIEQELVLRVRSLDRLERYSDFAQTVVLIDKSEIEVEHRLQKRVDGRFEDLDEDCYRDTWCVDMAEEEGELSEREYRVVFSAPLAPTGRVDSLWVD